MTREINQRELRNDSGSILQAAADGETFIVTRNGTPTAKLGPLPKRTFISKEEALRDTAHMPAVDGAELRAELDEAFDQEPFRD